MRRLAAIMMLTALGLGLAMAQGPEPGQRTSRPRTERGSQPTPPAAEPRDTSPQEIPRFQPPQSEQHIRELVPLKHLPASEILKSLPLGRFENAALYSIPGRNAIIVSAPASTQENLQAFIKELDQPARALTMELLILDLPLDEEGAIIAPEELQGPAKATFAKAMGLAKDKKSTYKRQVFARLVDGNQKEINLDSSDPFVTSRSGRPTPFGGREREGMPVPPTSYSVEYRNAGTKVRVKPSILGENTINLDLNIEDTRSLELPRPDDAKDLTVNAFVNEKYSGQVTLEAGSAVLIHRAVSESRGNPARQTLFLVTANMAK